MPRRHCDEQLVRRSSTSEGGSDEAIQGAIIPGCVEGPALRCAIARLPPGVSWPQPPLSWNLWQEPLSRGVWRGKYRVLTVIKPRKDRSRAFPKRIGVGTYRSHPGALARVAFSGSLRTGSAPQALAKSVSVFQEGAQRFIAGWSSPVARQAHNLKVIGSNPIPATSRLLPSSWD